MSTSSKDKENRRKCFKCSKSPMTDNIKLFRFPKPAVRNLLRCTLWAKFIFPFEESKYTSIKFQTMLFNEHRMLCQDHFLEEDFTDDTKQKLLRHAVPYMAEDLGIPQPFFDAPIPGPSQQPTHALTGTSSETILKNIGNISKEHIARMSKKPAVDSEPGSSCPMETKSISLGGTILTDTGSSKKWNICKAEDSQIKETQELPVESKFKTKKEKELYNKCAKYMKKLCQLRNRTKNLQKKVVLNKLTESNALLKLSKKLTPTFSLLLQGQIRNSNKKGTGKRWSKNEKIVALRLYKRSPTCYRLMRRLFNLPAQSTLKALLNKLPFTVGASERILNVLKNYIKTQSPADNTFILMFDEMSIKKNLQYNQKQDLIEGFQDHGAQGRSPNVASYALVFMISGVRKKVKQPIAHYFSSSYSSADRLAVLLKELLNKCLEMGINIIATVCDMDGVNRRALSILGATSEQPQIKIRDKEIITIFDTPHLLKCFRNLFIKYDVKFATEISSDDKMGIGTAKWSHIQKFYEIDNENSTNFVFAPALTKEHLNPNTRQKMRVKLAAQVLSHSVAAGLYAKISDGKLTVEAAATANLVANIDKLFDCLNSDSSDLRRGKIHSTNMRHNTPHINMLDKMNIFFKNMQFLGCVRPPPSQEGWTWTITGVKKIFNILSKKYKIKSLATRRLQQDPLENLFGCIRGNCGSNANPTTGQFVAGLKTAILSNLAHWGTTGNCESDSNTIIDNFDKFLSDSQSKKVKIASDDVLSKSIDFLEDSIDFDEITITEEFYSDEGNANVQACAYVCGFLVKKLPIDECHICKHLFISTTVQSFHLFVESKEYNDLKTSLKYCTKILVDIVESCASFINTYLTEHAHEINLKKTVLQAVTNAVNLEYFQKCSSHGAQNVKTLLNSLFCVCIKRFCICKNRAFADDASASALKRKINIILHK